MAFHPVFHEVFDSLRFGRILLVEISPPGPDGPGRYADVLVPDTRRLKRSHFSVPDAAAKVILAELDRGAAVDAIAFGGPGEPLRHGGVGSIVRKIRRVTHVPTLILTDGVLLSEREVRRDAGEADTIVAWLPALEDADAVSSVARAEAWERHVEGIGALRREARVRIALEIPVFPGGNDGPPSRDAWRRAVERIRPDRVFVVPDPRVGDPGESIGAALESVREAVHPRAGAFLPDGTIADQRTFVEI